MSACLIWSCSRRSRTSDSDSRQTSRSSVESRCWALVFFTPVARKQCVMLFVVLGLPDSCMSSVQRCFALFDYACGNFIACLAEPVAELPFHDILPVFVNGYDVDPVRVFENVEFRVDSPVGKPYGVLSDRKPRASEQVFARHRLPFSVFSDSVFHFTGCQS